MSSVFFSYAHEDEGLRDRLEKHLSMLKREGAISAWHDRRIVAGEPLNEVIDERLQQADIILLLVSADFLASEYCYGVEMKRAMERHADGSTRVIPVILKHCDWQSAPFGKLLAAPKDGKPVTTWTHEDEGFLDVVRQIRAALPANNSSVVESLQLPAAVTTAVRTGPRSSNLRLRKTFTDADRDRFLDEAFDYMAKYFQNSLNELKNRNPDIEYRLKSISSSQFGAVIYKSGSSAAECTITRGGPFGKALAYLNRFDESSRTSGWSYNEGLSVENDDQHLFMRPYGIALMGRDGNAELSFEGAAEYYWSMLIEPLQH